MSVPPLYPYKPLATGTTIRILVLHPAEDFAAPLEVSILHYDRRGEYINQYNRQDGYESHVAGHYEAASYAWGEPIFSQHIMIRNPLSTLKITANVDSMLRHFRKVRKDRCLWVDAICLNQTDADEKSIQVRKMGEIFAEAVKVHVWLGLDTRSVAEDVFTYLRNLTVLNRSSVESEDIRQGFFGGSQRFLNEDLQQLLSLPWFQRRWVLQEVALAHNVTVHCGGQRLPWSWIRGGITMYHEGYGKVQEGWAERSIPHRVKQAIENVISLSGGSADSTTILQLLWNHQVSFKDTSKCIDDRDRIFALYGMVSPESRSVFDPFTHCPVDYTRHWTDTYTDLAVAAIEGEQGLEVLTHAIGFGNLAQQDTKWPSWVPDWTQTRKSQEAMKFTGLCDSFDSSPAFLRRESKLTLCLKGAKMQRIVGTQRSAGVYGAVAYFKSLENNRLTYSTKLTYGKITAWVLARAVNDSRIFYDRTDFDFDAVFDGMPASFPKEIKTDYDSKMYNVEMILNQQLGVPVPKEYLPSSPINMPYFHQEVDRVLKGHDLFCYELQGSIAPGVAFCRVEVGDYVVRLRDVSIDQPSKYALVLRSHALPPTSTHPASSAYRLVGACVDSHPFTNDFSVYSYTGWPKSHFEYEDVDVV